MMGSGSFWARAGLGVVLAGSFALAACQPLYGGKPEKLVELIGKLRELIDKALDWLFAKNRRFALPRLATLTAAVIVAIGGFMLGGGLGGKGVDDGEAILYVEVPDLSFDRRDACLRDLDLNLEAVAASRIAPEVQIGVPARGRGGDEGARDIGSRDTELARAVTVDLNL